MLRLESNMGPESWQTASQVAVAVGLIITALGGFGNSYFGKQAAKDANALTQTKNTQAPLSQDHNGNGDNFGRDKNEYHAEQISITTNNYLSQVPVSPLLNSPPQASHFDSSSSNRKALIASLVQASVASGYFSTLKRKPEIVVPEWIATLSDLNVNRNTHDLQNLFEVRGRILRGLTGKDYIEEAKAVTKYLSELGYLKTTDTGVKKTYWGEQFQNQIIEFLPASKNLL